MEPKPLKTFIIYSHEDLSYKTGLEKFLRHLVRKGKIELWSDKEIKPGEYWDAGIKLNLSEAEVILMLVSVDFYNSEYIQDTEFQRARGRFDRGEALVIPVLVRYCPWKSYDLIKDLQVLPSGARSVDTWASIDQAFTDIAEHLERAVDELLECGAAERRRQAEVERREAEEKIAYARETLHRQRDEAAWKTAAGEAEKAARTQDEIAAYEVYLESGYTAYADEATRRIHALEAEETKRRIAERKKAQEAIEKQTREEAKRQQPQNGQTKRDIFLSSLTRAKFSAVPTALETGPDMTFVEGGTFQMGSYGSDNEKPLHAVTVPAFWIGKYPVTFAEYDGFCAANGREKPGDKGWGRGHRPVINVSWDDARAYCDWLGQCTGKKYRLPSEAEWEFAARGGTLSKGYKFAGGNALDQLGWFWENSGDKPLSGGWNSTKVVANNCRTHPVGKKNANELGLHDMSGNVWEWCADHWHDNYVGAPTDGSAWVKGGDDTRRVLRGGSWDGNDNSSRAFLRLKGNLIARNSTVGFRLAQD